MNGLPSMIPGMRAALGTGLFLLVLVPACGRSEAASRPSEDRMVLRVGGAGRPLREYLGLRGVEPVASRPTAPPPRADSRPDSPLAVPPTHVLEKGETLSQISQRYYGTAQRWREIARFNGWSETQVNTLRPGTLVRLPLLPAAQPGGDPGPSRR